MAIARADGAPLIPGIVGMTKELHDRLAVSEQRDVFFKVEKILAEDAVEDADLEYILSLVRSLRDVAGSTGARGLTRAELEDLDDAMSNTIAQLASPLLPKTETPYHSVMRWVGGTARDFPVELFTTNYDLLAEQALEDVGVPYFDGFVGARDAFFDVRAIEDDDLPTRWARLWKLHGSINWCLSADGSVIRRPNADGAVRRLIHPSHLKYEESRRMPYLALIDRLRAFLRRSNAVLVTCGYSFRDQHVNEVLRDGLERNPTAVVFGLLHGDLVRYEKAVGVAQRTGNLLLLARDEAMVGRTRGAWHAVETDSEEAIPGVDVADGVVRFQLGDFRTLAELLRDLAGAAA